MNDYALHSRKTWAATYRELEAEFRRWDVKDWDARRIAGAGVAVRWWPRGADAPITLQSDDQRTHELNFRKLYLIIEALRLNEVRGFTSLARSYYLQLPAGEPDPYEVLGVRRDSRIEIIEGAYKAQLKLSHPDAGGDAGVFKMVQRAWERIKEERDAVPK